MPASVQPRSFRQLAFKTLAILIGIVAIAFAYQDRSALNRVKSVGKPAIVEPITNYTRMKSRGSTTYTAQFAFKTEEGQAISQKRSFPEELLEDFERGIPVKVLYDPRNPHEFVFEKETASWFIFVFGAACILVGIFIL